MADCRCGISVTNKFENYTGGVYDEFKYFAMVSASKILFGYILSATVVFIRDQPHHLGGRMGRRSENERGILDRPELVGCFLGKVLCLIPNRRLISVV